ncbi:MAG TPA: helicase-related protein, partial [Thermoanaerobaculia bacterium]|nr:helicase-related protein [Thermoanaerobaculia bacterium]
MQLPVDGYIDEIVATVRAKKRAVVVAPPGSGKTTRIPPALSAALGNTILLQPRRVAARALTRRIAQERGWRVGEEIGWHIRFERRFSPRTKLLVATEGILTARLQSDPLLSDFNVVVLDEFHERSIHADLALALARQAALSRDDLALVVMSATLDAGPIARFLDAPVIEIDARQFPIEVSYRPGESVVEAVRELLPTARGHVLCFLPGAREIDRTIRELENLLPAGEGGRRPAEGRAIENDPGASHAPHPALRATLSRGERAITILPLHGSLDVDEQERALAPSDARKVIVATNVAETSLTVEGVTDVIDSGLHKVLRYDAETAVDHLVTEQIAADSAEQRAGRAGRTAPGRTTRLWDSRSILRPHREPEIRRVDLASPALDIVSWGGDPLTFEWFERPPEERLTAAMELLEELGAVKDRKLTAIGEQIRRFPLHPRLARMVLAANGADDVIALAAELSEGKRTDAGQRAIVRDLSDIAKRILGDAYRRDIEDIGFRKAVLAGYPDRVAMRREKSRPALLLATGTGATLAREIENVAGDFFVVLEIRNEFAYRVVPIDRDWLQATRRETRQEIAGDRLRAVERTCYFEIPLHEQTVPADSVAGAAVIGAELRRRMEPELAHRVAFAGIDIDWEEVSMTAAAGASRLSDVNLAASLPFDVRRKLDQLAPATFALPSGRNARLEYREDGSVVASAKL